MASGGARARSGPPKDPDALRRDRGPEWLRLPKEGRDGPAPEWPLVDPSERELSLWADLWTMPQALMWERQRQEMVVGLYVRTFAAAEVIDAPVARAQLAKQLAEDLGLTTAGLARNEWIIEPSDADAAVAAPAKAKAKKDRPRFTVVADAGA